MPSNPLDMSEREEIRAGIAANRTDAEIGERLSRHRCTVNSEINRNGGRARYRACKAQARAERQSARPKLTKLEADPGLADYVTKRLKLKDSPMTISIELARGVHGMVAAISHETLYEGIYSQCGLPAGLHEGLHRQHKRRKKRVQDKPVQCHSLGSFTPISARPPIALERSEVGHLEGDLIIGAFNRSALATLFDRASRHLWLIALPGGKGADSTFEALLKALSTIPEHLRRTLTWDQGSELARHVELAERTGFDIYIADKNAPWQRPTNENGNGLVRRWVGKSTDLNIYTPQQLRAIQNRINTIPRRSLGWLTAQDLYHAAVAMTG
jgi:IS30 family transposase